VVAAVLAFAWRRPSVLFAVVAAAAVGDLTSYGLRAEIPRDRPPLRYPDPEPLVRVPGTNSFPSGHATTSFACAAVLAWLWPRLAAPLLALAALIAFSRVYVGVHYPLDVLGGALLGLAVAVVIRVTAPRWRAAGLRLSGRLRKAS
jgi:undecaprenyl-diphosphatase